MLKRHPIASDLSRKREGNSVLVEDEAGVSFLAKLNDYMLADAHDKGIVLCGAVRQPQLQTCHLLSDIAEIGTMICSCYVTQRKIHRMDALVIGFPELQAAGVVHAVFGEEPEELLHQGKLQPLDDHHPRIWRNDAPRSLVKREPRVAPSLDREIAQLLVQAWIRALTVSVQQLRQSEGLRSGVRFKQDQQFGDGRSEIGVRGSSACFNLSNDNAPDEPRCVCDRKFCSYLLESLGMSLEYFRAIECAWIGSENL
jgi:hypothetical protein